MCRNIRVLHNFKPPTTPDEIRAAALQYVRKVSGTRAPSRADAEAFDAAVDAVADATTALLAALPAKSPPRTRDGELAKARAKWAARAQRIQSAR
jgi:hypothetical protein